MFKKKTANDLEMQASGGLTPFIPHNLVNTNGVCQELILTQYQAKL